MGSDPAAWRFGRRRARQRLRLARRTRPGHAVAQPPPARRIRGRGLPPRRIPLLLRDAGVHAVDRGSRGLLAVRRRHGHRLAPRAGRRRPDAQGGDGPSAFPTSRAGAAPARGAGRPPPSPWSVAGAQGVPTHRPNVSFSIIMNPLLPRCCPATSPCRRIGGSRPRRARSGDPDTAGTASCLPCRSDGPRRTSRGPPPP